MTDWLAEATNRNGTDGTRWYLGPGAISADPIRSRIETISPEIADMAPMAPISIVGKGPESSFFNNSIPSDSIMEVTDTPPHVSIYLEKSVPSVPYRPENGEDTEEIRICAVCSSQIPRNRPVSTVCSADCALNQPDLDPIPSRRELVKTTS